jgi:hypothetical protein
MLIYPKKYLFIYVVDRDLGFAPNPFHGYCTLATCKPGIRNSACVGDWVMGVGGTRLKATGRCVFILKITEIQTFDEYWIDSRFKLKKPVRNGSPVMMVGDNIYHKDNNNSHWVQEDSHHSNPDGSTNLGNLKRDTKSNRVLISSHFYYFGFEAPYFDSELINYSNNRGYSKKHVWEPKISQFISKIEEQYRVNKNIILADPFNFDIASKRVDQLTGKIR